jgi:hypothetical protein
MSDNPINHLQPNTIKEYIFQVNWKDPVNDVLRTAHQDLVESVEDSAKALGLLLISKLTPYTAGRQAIRGTFVDYYLVDANATLPFQSQTTATVEFTGILNNVDRIENRMKSKRDRLPPSRQYPVYIVCVEHSFPLAKIEKVAI